MAAINYDYIHKFWIQAELTQPMHVGNGVGGSEEVLIHPVTREPFVQATGIAGPFRAFYATGKTAIELGDVFGISGEELPKVPEKKKASNKVMPIHRSTIRSGNLRKRKTLNSSERMMWRAESALQMESLSRNRRWNSVPM